MANRGKRATKNHIKHAFVAVFVRFVGCVQAGPCGYPGFVVGELTEYFGLLFNCLNYLLNAKSVSTLLFPFEQIETYVRSFKNGVRGEKNCISWDDHDGVTSLSVESINKSTDDGLIVSEQVFLEHVSEALNRYTISEIAHLNKFATTGAILPKNENQPARIVSKVGIFKQDGQAAERNYAPIVAGTCATIGWHAALLARGIFEVDPDTSSLNGVRDETQVSESEFQDAAKRLRANNLFLNQDSDGLTVEFPWEEGAVSNVFLDDAMRRSVVENNPNVTDEDLDRMAGKTSLLRIRKSMHPFFGNGVFSSLELPISIEELGLPVLIDLLNQWEIANADLPPGFGAWCLGPRAPSYVTFFPNQLCIPGVVQNISMWSLVRAFKVRDFLRKSGDVNF